MSAPQPKPKPAPPPPHWRAAQKLRFKLGKALGLLPQAETEMVFQQLILTQMEVVNNRKNFANILRFMDIVNSNFDTAGTAHNQLVARVKALEDKLAKYEADDDDGSYVQ